MTVFFIYIYFGELILKVSVVVSAVCVCERDPINRAQQQFIMNVMACWCNK